MAVVKEIISVAKSVGIRLRSQFGLSVMGKVFGRGYGGDRSVAADLLADKLCISKLGKFDCEIVSEESGIARFGEPKIRFIIDPLDGSTNFSRGLLPWCVSIFAETIDQKQLAGVVYDPMRDECFWAENGKAAYLNKKRIKVKNRPIEKSVLSFNFSHVKLDTTLKAVGLLNPRVRGIYKYGSAAASVCWVACGRIDGHIQIEPGFRPFDYLASLLILKGAGGIATDLTGRPLPREGSGLIACGSKDLHKQLLRLIKP